MKKTLSTFIVLMFSFLALQATVVEVDGIKYNINTTNKTASVSPYDSDNYYANNGQYYKGDIQIPTTVKYESDIYTVNNIGPDAFNQCSKLTSITIPNSVESIEVSAFRSCDGLSSLTLPNSLTKIGQSAFEDCKNLKSLLIPNSVTEIGESAFQFCSSLESVTIGSSVNTISYQAFYECGIKQLVFVDSENAIRIEYNAFTGLNNVLEKLDIGRDISSYIDNFQNSIKLQKVTIGDKVTTLNKDLFKNCSNELVINIPASVTEIQDGAFENDYTTLIFSSTIPATIGNAFNGPNLLIVPNEAYDDYCEAWKDYKTQIISESSEPNYEVEVEAKENYSDVLYKVLNGGDETKALSVINLKVKGSINGYDIMVMRNKMLNLRNLDLSEANIVANAYEYYTGYHSTNDEIGPFSFYNLSNLKSVKLPNSVKTISGASFAHCKNLESLVFGEENTIIEKGRDELSSDLGAFRDCNLKNIVFNKKLQQIGSGAFSHNPCLEEIELNEDLEIVSSSSFSFCGSLTKIKMGPNLKTIEGWAFAGCSKLKDIVFSPALISIGEYCFRTCVSLEKLQLPTSLQSIGRYAFYDCTSLKVVRIPPSITEIGDEAFYTSSITDIYTWTIEPTNINQETFHSDLYTRAMLHVPATSKGLYYWDTQWSQFQSTCEFNEPYEYFYLKNKDLIEDNDTPRIEGEEGENPDADIHPGGGLVVNGDNEQALGDTNIIYDGNETSGSIIGGDSSTSQTGGNVNIDNLTIKIQITANRWYFFAFPFDIPLKGINCEGQFVWRYYDGEHRALNGNGAWKTFEGQVLERGKGYIFQCSKTCTLTLHIGRAAFDGKEKIIELETHAATNVQNASWNLVGNPFTSYYSICDIDYQSPITIWNGSTYAAFNPNDDDMVLHPFQAFFVQKPDAETNMGFKAKFQITKNKRDDQATVAASRARRINKARSLVNRDIINIEVSDGSTTDMTRVVFNEQALGSYELTCDASKFMSDSAPQIYTMDADDVQYSINERPLAEGTVRVGFKANHSGSFTLSASRLDRQMWLKDTETGAICDLSNEEYQFTSDAGTFEDRFILMSDYTEATGISEIENEVEASAVYYDINGMRLPSLKDNGFTIVRKGTKVEKVLSK